MKVIGTQLGRLAPYHRAHQDNTEAILARHGASNTLILVGSSDTFNQRTPFTFEDRRKLIHAIFPDLNVLPLPDINPALLVHAESTIPLWLEQIEEIQSRLGARLKFYGGSTQDLRFFEGKFESEVLVDRETTGRGISATEVRKHLLTQDREALKSLMDERIIDEAIEMFHRNMRKLGLL